MKRERGTMEHSEINKVFAKFAHEVRNPLQRIILSAQMLERELRVTSKVRGRLHTIADATNEVNKLIEGMLHSYKTPKLELEALDISQVLDNVLQDLEHEINQANVRIIKDYAINLPMIKADKLRTSQIFVNLIRNAVQAMPSGGTLSITNKIMNGRELKNIPGLQARDIGADQVHQKFIKMIFADSGAGIVKEDLPKIFTPFYTTKASGMGLGLPIVKEIVETYGGFIHVESQEKCGSQFFILLPIRE